MSDICAACMAFDRKLSADDALVMGIVMALQSNAKGIASRLCEMHAAMVYHTHEQTKGIVPVEHIRTK